MSVGGFAVDSAMTPDPGPFLIDGPEYSDRDREMFVLGFEYALIICDVSAKPDGMVIRMIHAANMGRARKAANDAGLSCWFAPTGDPAWVEFGIGRQY